MLSTWLPSVHVIHEYTWTALGCWPNSTCKASAKHLPDAKTLGTCKSTYSLSSRQITSGSPLWVTTTPTGTIPYGEPPNSGFPVLRIQDVYPGSEFFHPGSKRFRNGSAYPSKNLCIFNQKNCLQAFGNTIWDVHSGSRFFSPSRIKGSKRHWIPYPQHCGIQ